MALMITDECINCDVSVDYTGLSRLFRLPDAKDMVEEPTVRNVPAIS